MRLASESGGPAADNDGVMDIAPSDTLQLTYNDSLTGEGSSCELQATMQVINLFGDTTLNGSISAFDAARVLSMAVGLLTPTSEDTLVCDVSGNGDVSAMDGSLVLQYNVSFITRFPVQDSVTPANHPFLKPPASSGLVALGGLRHQSDGSYLLPVQLKDREGIVSGQMVVTYEGDAEVTDVTLGAGYGTYLVAHRSEPGRVHIALAGAQSVSSGAGDVVHINLRSEAGSTLQFQLAEATLNGHRVLTSPQGLEVVVSSGIPRSYQRHQNVPNPFNPSTVIEYEIAQPGEVRISVYNAIGQHIRTLVQTHQDANAYRLVWDGTDDMGRGMGAGVYLVRMQSGTFAKVRKVLLLR